MKDEIQDQSVLRNQIAKFNEKHDDKGQFASGDGGGAGPSADAVNAHDAARREMNDRHNNEVAAMDEEHRVKGASLADRIIDQRNMRIRHKKEREEFNAKDPFKTVVQPRPIDDIKADIKRERKATMDAQNKDDWKTAKVHNQNWRTLKDELATARKSLKR